MPMGGPGREGRPKALPSGRKGSSSARNVEPHNHGEWMRQIGWTGLRSTAAFPGKLMRCGINTFCTRHDYPYNQDVIKTSLKDYLTEM